MTSKASVETATVLSPPPVKGLPPAFAEVIGDWRRVLILPTRWRSVTSALSNFSITAVEAHLRHAESEDVVETLVPIAFSKATNIRWSTGPGNSKRMKATLRDASGNSLLLICDDPIPEITDYLHQPRQSLQLAGQIKRYGSTYLAHKQLLVTHEQVGSVTPVYQFRTTTRRTAETQSQMAAAIAAGLDRDATSAAVWIVNTLFKADQRLLEAATGIPAHRALEFFARALVAIHRPVSADRAGKAIEALDRAAALYAVTTLRAQPAQVAPLLRPVLSVFDLQARFGRVLTKDQKSALKQILVDLAGAVPMIRILAGDTGSGKTAVFGLSAVAAAHAGAVVAILCPSESLATQTFDVLRTMGSELAVDLVVGKTAVPASSGGRIVVGTTALLHKGNLLCDYVVVDEQQAFGAIQREQLCQRNDGKRAHLLEATATCIPRSMALIEMGAVAVSSLTTCHVQRDIQTRIWPNTSIRDLYAEVRATVKAGGKVIVMYPALGKESESPGQRSAAELRALSHALDKWEQQFPGQCRAAFRGTATNRAELNQQAIADVRSGRASILLGTTIVERGLDIPGVTRVVAVQAERFGLSQLHQVRGRAGRQGGRAYCDLLLLNEISDKAMRRLKILVSTNNGYDIAAADLAERGSGDLSGAGLQHGKAPSPFLGRALDASAIEWALDTAPVLPGQVSTEPVSVTLRDTHSPSTVNSAT